MWYNAPKTKGRTNTRVVQVFQPERHAVGKRYFVVCHFFGSELALSGSRVRTKGLL